MPKCLFQLLNNCDTNYNGILYSVDNNHMMYEIIDEMNRRQNIPLAKDYINGKIIYTESNDQPMPASDGEIEIKIEIHTSDKTKGEE